MSRFVRPDGHAAQPPGAHAGAGQADAAQIDTMRADTAPADARMTDAQQAITEMDATQTLPIAEPCALGEGILWCDRRRVLYWTDIVAGALWRHDPASGDTRRWVLPEALGCLALVEDGRLLLGLAKGLHVCDVEAQLAAATLHTELLVAVEACDPHTRLNDGRADRHGGFVFGTKSEYPDARRSGRFYRYSAASGLQTLALPMAAIPNAICFDATGTRMWFCDSIDPTILECRYDGTTGAVSDVCTFVTLDVPGAAADGAIIDAEGALWSAQWGAGRVVRYLPDGRIDAIVHLPVPQPSCCALGADTLYITTAHVALDAAARARAPLSGHVFNVALPRALARASDRVRLP